MTVTTGLVVMIWLGVLFGVLIAMPAREAKETRPAEPQEQEVSPPTTRTRTPNRPAKVVPMVPRSQRQTRTQKALLQAVEKANGAIAGSKSELARQLKVSRNTLDTTVQKLVDSGDAVANWDGSKLRIAAA